jgi:DNA-binding response OmpR family regulator
MVPATPSIVVCNSSPDAIALLTAALSRAGFDVLWVLIPDLRSGRLDIDRFLADHDARVLVYDIAAPYDDNWTFLQQLRSRPSMAGRRFVITSPNAHHVEELAGRDETIYEVVGKPYDLDAITRAVKEAIRARQTSGHDRRQRSRTVAIERRSGVDRREHTDRRAAAASEWTDNELYGRLTDKLNAMENDRRQQRRRADDRPDHGHAA